MKREDREVERALIIASGDTEGIVEKMDGLNALSSYILQDRRSQRIIDSYFDTHTEKGKLAHDKIALRLRKVNSKELIALKGPSHIAGERFELELPWSKEAAMKISSALQKRGISFKIPSRWKSSEAKETLKGFGLFVVQERETHRILWDICKKTEETIEEDAIAELSIDSTAYPLQSVAKHTEIEIEAKTEEGILAINEIESILMNLFSPSLRSWNYGKLATGKAIKELLAQDKQFKSKIANRSFLSIEDYAKIEEKLKEI